MSRLPAALMGLAIAIAAANPALAQNQLQLRLTPERLQLKSGERAAVVVTASTNDGSPVPAFALTWTSTDTGVVQVEADAESPEVGRLVAGHAGTAVVQAVSGPVCGFVAVRVEAAPAAPPTPPPPPVRRSIDLPAIAQANREAVALVTMWAGPESFDATGFVISPAGYLVTTRSAVSRQGLNADSVLVTLSDRRESQRADILNVGEVGVDLAVLRVRDYHGPFVRRVDWSGNRVRQTEPAAVIGFPGGASRALDATGVPHASIYGGTFNLVSPERLQYDALTSPGSGGSPVFNADGDVVGVHRARMSDGSTGIGVPIGDLVRLMPPGLKAELGIN
ncbi:MAG: hypothetical protein EXR93_02315 [Gemmatimonadetes bacterium]|nr:hypothetical protein [Gemmatimonadota bacterium]